MCDGGRHLGWREGIREMDGGVHGIKEGRN